MRPQRLFPLFADIAALPGVGPRNRALFERVAGGGRVIDLLWHLPTGLVDRRRRPTIATAVPGEVVTIAGVVDSHQPGATRRQPYRVLLRDESGFLTLTFFHAREDWLGRVLPVGETRIVSGRLELFQERPQITHPDYILAPEEAAALPDLEPLYPLTQGLTQKRLRHTIEAALARVPELPEWILPELLVREGWQGWKESIVAAHAPRCADDLAPAHPARRRLAYDELLANQLALALVRHRARRRKGRARWRTRASAS